MLKLNVAGLLMNQALFRDVSPVELDRLQTEVVKVELDKGSLVRIGSPDALKSYQHGPAMLH